MDFHTAIYVPQKSLMKMNDYLRSDFIDYSDEKFAEYETIAKYTGKFADGCEVDLKLNTNTAEDGDVYAEMVLFRDGCEITHSEPEFSEVDGACWYLYHGDDVYRIDVLPE